MDGRISCGAKQSTAIQVAGIGRKRPQRFPTCKMLCLAVDTEHSFMHRISALHWPLAVPPFTVVCVALQKAHLDCYFDCHLGAIVVGGVLVPLSPVAMVK